MGNMQDLVHLDIVLEENLSETGVSRWPQGTACLT